MEKKQGIGFFEKYLTIWVALCIIIGIAVGQWLPAIPQTLSKFEYANVSIPEMCIRDRSFRKTRSTSTFGYRLCFSYNFSKELQR